MSTSKPYSVAEIREAFLSYFESKDHTRVESSSLIPQNDPTLLFTNAGMNPFKDTFLGVEKRSFTRATSVQKCVRAGGKHNDLENVGFTARHHTFFEMLGNFSFGDYFKKESIHFAWDFVTNVLKLPKDRLRVSVYKDDDEAAEIWHKQEGLALEQIVRFDEDNFWQMGDTGPCGPCSEIFYDQGKEVDGDRWLEFWNCVFMQYDRNLSGQLNALPRPSVDTGMGLERMAAIMQGVGSNYDIDLLSTLLKSTAQGISEQRGRKLQYIAGHSGDWEQSALRVIVDHLRATSFLIADGVLPSNEGRGYVLRRILRRALRFSTRLGAKGPILHLLFPRLEESMSSAYPELKSRSTVITEVLKQEEERFLETLERGLEILENSFEKIGSQKTLPAEVVFKLYDSFGFPEDLTALIARERGLRIDENAVKKLMNEQQEKSRASWKGSSSRVFVRELKKWKSAGITNTFSGYEKTHEDKSTVLAVEKDPEGHAWISIDPCPFYAESGGQVSDKGEVLSLDKKHKWTVLDVQKIDSDLTAIKLSDPNDKLRPGLELEAQVDTTHRTAVLGHHSSTHLLHAALRDVLGTHVAQAGSWVGAEALRFDFSHGASLSKEEIQKVEDWVNKSIASQTPVLTRVCPQKEAIEAGALALFGEKYGDLVRSVQMPGLSHELCGGLHVKNTAELRYFKIFSEGAVAAGTRRIEAQSGSQALSTLKESEESLHKIAAELKCPVSEIEQRVIKMKLRERELEKELQKAQRALLRGQQDNEKTLEGEIKGTKFLLRTLPKDSDIKILREEADRARKDDPETVHIFLSGERILLTLEPSKLPGFHAGELLNSLAKTLGAKGGGQAQTAQGKVKDEPGVPEKVLAWAQSL